MSRALVQPMSPWLVGDRPAKLLYESPFEVPSATSKGIVQVMAHPYDNLKKMPPQQNLWVIFGENLEVSLWNNCSAKSNG